MSLPKEHRYEIDVVGHQAPFKWTLHRIPFGSTRVSAGKSGEADTMELAISDAETAAEQAHWLWVHQNTKETVVVFTVPVDEKPPESGPSAAELDRIFQMTAAEDPVMKQAPERSPKTPDIDPADYAD